MRLLKYFSYSSLDEQTNKFRCAHIKLIKTEEENELHNIIKYVKEKYNIQDDIFLLTEELNSRIKGYYKGQYKFDFTMSEEGIPLSKIKLPTKIENKIRIQMFESNDKLAKIKKFIESNQQ
jgi:hypothetical protein